ncbi:MAG: hypothetical protein GX952_06930 [Firmicutes bacterium]|nr:hypothetical protein [Bacillota bacterium]
MAKITTIGPDTPPKGRWLIWAGIFIAVLVLLSLLAMLLNFLGIVDFSTLPLALPWFRSPAEESEQILKEEQLAMQIVDLQADRELLLGSLEDKKNEIALLKAEVERLETEIKQLIEQEQAITDMAAIYAKMDPAAAAAILEKLSAEEVLPILGKLKKDQAAAILAELDGDLASKITRAWAAR